MIGGTGELTSSARFAAQPLSGGGTPTSEWTSWTGRSFPELDLSSCPGLVVVAPHPDDETLGFGGTVAMLNAAGVGVQVVSVSDGGAAHRDRSTRKRRRLERTRRAELQRAASILGVGEPLALGLPDGQLGDHVSRLDQLLTGILQTVPAGTWCAATWRGDGHPDHEAVGRAASLAAAKTGAVLIEYPVWMWHWAAPDDSAVPWRRARTVPLNRFAVDRKRLAAQSFRSQFTPTTPGGGPVLPPFVLRRLLAVGEVAFV